MADRIVYEAKTSKSEFHETPIPIAAFSKDDLKAIAAKGWTEVDWSTLETRVVDVDEEARALLKPLTPLERLILKTYFYKPRTRGAN